MAQEVTTTEGREVVQSQPMTPAPLFQPRDIDQRGMVGAIEVESARAIAEAQAAMVVAQRHPRDEIRAFAAIRRAASRYSFASSAFYSYRRGGQVIEGPSIRMAEELARVWGNIKYGLKELSQGEGYSEMLAFAHDLETNTSNEQMFTVKHIRDKTGGGVALTEQRDIYEIGANMGARRMRARILAILPADFVEDCIAACKETLAAGERGANGQVMPLPDRINRCVKVFEKIGVTIPMLEARLGHPITETTGDELATLQGVHKALKDGVSTIAEEFGTSAPDQANRLNDAAKKEAPKKEAPAKDPPKAQAKPEPEPAQKEAQQPAKEEPKAAAKAAEKEEPKAEAPKEEPKPEPVKEEPKAEAKPAEETKPAEAAEPEREPGEDDDVF